MTHYSDPDGAQTAAQLAAGFDWSWKLDDMQRFCDAAGWTLGARDDLIASIRTNFRLPANESAAYLVSDLLTPELALLGDGIMSFGTVVAKRPNSAENPGDSYLDDRYEEVCNRFQLEFGTPDRHYDDPTPEVMWELPSVFISIKLFEFAVILKFINPNYQAWVDEHQEEDD